MQDHYNLINQEEEREMFPLCADEKIGVLPWSPLARGRLTRDPDASTNRQGFDKFGQALYQQMEAADSKIASAVAAVAAERGVTRAQIALAWVSHNPVVTAPIFGATKLSHLDEAVASLDIQLRPEEVEQLTADYVPHQVAGF
jgi:aryl-alcohol dehydrogenase-like predicted oxidoreductase